MPYKHGSSPEFANKIWLRSGMKLYRQTILLFVYQKNASIIFKFKILTMFTTQSIYSWFEITIRHDKEFFADINVVNQ